VDGPVEFLKIDIEGAEERVLDELIESGKIEFVRQGIIEYHHRIPGKRSHLGAFLSKLESCGFDYQLSAVLWPVSSRDRFQDISIGFFRSQEIGRNPTNT
jgi:hypothetical protein